MVLHICRAKCFVFKGLAILACCFF